jgi:hypothetical protein
MLATRFLSLLGAAAVSAMAATYVVATRPDFTTASFEVGGPMLPYLSERAAKAVGIEVAHLNYGLTLMQRNSVWVAPELGNYPVEPETIANILSALAAMTRLEAKTNNPDWYGFIRVGGDEAPTDKRGIRMTVSAAEGEILGDLIVGRASGSIGYSDFGGTFVRAPSEDRSWLVQGGVDIPSSRADWFGQILSLPGVDLSSITVLRGDEVMLDVRKSAVGGASTYKFVSVSPEIAPTGVAVENQGIKSLAQAVVSVNFDDVRSREGLQVPLDARKVRFLTKGGLSLEATLVPADGKIWTLFDASAASDSSATNLATTIAARVDRWAFLLEQRKTTLLATPLESLVAAPSLEVPLKTNDP